jgi:hypothetical protein
VVATAVRVLLHVQTYNAERRNLQRPVNGIQELIYDIGTDILIYIHLTAIGLTPDGSSTVHIYTQTVHRIQRTEHTYQSKS